MSSPHSSGPPRLTIDQLRADILAGDVDTVIVAFTDMQGRLQGKRLHGHFFLDHVLDHGTEGCNYLLAVDVDMNTVDGYRMSSWQSGYGDFVMAHDLSTLRRVPWHPGTVMVQADVQWLDGSDVTASPRQVLKRQLARLADAGMAAYVGTELEFIVFTDTYEQAWAKGYREGGPEALRPRPKGRPRKGDSPPRPKTREQELEDENRRLRAEVAYLKKLRALEASRRAPGRSAG